MAIGEAIGVNVQLLATCVLYSKHLQSEIV